jgi:hypothetical protein
MAFRDEEGAITCNLIDGKNRIIEWELSTRSIKILIGDNKLRIEVCAYLGMGEEENAKSERLEGEAIKITPASGVHKAEEFCYRGKPFIFKPEDVMQLMTIVPEKKDHLPFKNHFCRGRQVDFKNHYKFCRRRAKQEVNYSAIKGLVSNQPRFYWGKIEPEDEPGSENEVKILVIKKVPGLSALSEGCGSSLDGIYYRKNRILTVEFTAFQYRAEQNSNKKMGNGY